MRIRNLEPKETIEYQYFFTTIKRKRIGYVLTQQKTADDPSGIWRLRDEKGIVFNQGSYPQVAEKFRARVRDLCK